MFKLLIESIKAVAVVSRQSSAVLGNAKRRRPKQVLHNSLRNRVDKTHESKGLKCIERMPTR